MNDTIEDLVKEGLTAARVGDIEDARRLLRRATIKMPDNVEAWIALAGVVDSLHDKQECFQKALKIDPANAEAQLGLTLVEEKLDKQRAEIINAEADAGVGMCYRHPDTETGLRCAKCNKFICPKCAVRSPVGFRCPECVREQEDKYYTGSNMDYVIAAVISFPLSLILAGLFTMILAGFGFFMLIIGFFVAPAIGGFIAEAVRWGVGKRRSRYLRHVVTGCLIAATLPFLIFGFLSGGFWGLILPGMFMFLGSATINARLR